MAKKRKTKKVVPRKPSTGRPKYLAWRSLWMDIRRNASDIEELRNDPAVHRKAARELSASAALIHEKLIRIEGLRLGERVAQIDTMAAEIGRNLALLVPILQGLSDHIGKAKAGHKRERARKR